MRKLTIALLIAGVALVGGCGGGGGGGGNGGGGGTGDTIVTGRVVRTPGGAAVAGVRITLGGWVQSTAADGSFSINLGNNVPVSIVATTFNVSTHLLPTEEYDSFPVTFNGLEYDQPLDNSGAVIPLPANVIATQGQTVDLGTITVKWVDPELPPPPPF